jgi:hypothetical protein
MAEERSPAARRPRRATTAQRLLARTRRFQGHGGTRLAASVLARRRATTQAIAPRLLPQRETRARAPASLGLAAERPTGAARDGAVAPPEGMSEFAAEWLFGEGAVEGIPFAGGAAIPAESRSERPAFLTAAPSARPPAVAARVPAPGARPRGRIQEGPVRLSAMPPAQSDAPVPPPREPVSSADPTSSTDPASSADPRPTSAPGPATASSPAGPAPPAPPGPAATPPPRSTGDLARSASSAPAVPAVPDPSDAAIQAPPPAPQAPPVVVAPRRPSEPASTPPPRAPVALRRVARAPATAIASPPASPPRGLLRRAIDRILPTRRGQVGASVPPPPARGDSGPEGMPAPSRRSVSARVARSPAGQADALASTPRDLPSARASTAFEPPAQARSQDASQSPDRGTPPVGSSPPAGAQVDRDPLGDPAAAPVSSQPSQASAPASSSSEETHAPSRPAPTVARVARAAGEASLRVTAEEPTGSLPPRRRTDPGESHQPGPATASVRGPGPRTSVAASDTQVSRASAPSGLRRALARLRATRAPQPPPAQDRPAAPAASAPIARSSSAASAVVPATVEESPAGPRHSPAADVGAVALRSLPVPGAIHAPEIPASAAPAPAPGMTRSSSSPSVRPPVRLRQVAPRSSAPQLTRAAAPRRGLHAQPGVRTSGERLAGATGAALHRELATGMETIEFPIGSAAGASGSVSASSLLARAAAGGGPPSAEAPAAATPAGAPVPAAAMQPGAPPAEAGGGAQGGAPTSHAGASPEADDLYEHVIERLRRDLLTERERMGDLLGDLP